MGRWAPDTRERLQAAAWELFSTTGYDETTVAQIAERAGVNRATFFRHFADKQEILFGESTPLDTAFVEAIRAAPADANVTECLDRALRAAGAVMTPEQQPRSRQRRRVAESSPEVQERGLAKNARIVAGIVAALVERGEDQLTARLGAEMTMLAFGAAVREWSEAEVGVPFAPYATEAMAQIRSRAARLVGAA